MRFTRAAQPTAAQQTRKRPREPDPLDVARALARSFAETKPGANGHAHSTSRMNSRQCIIPRCARDDTFKGKTQCTSEQRIANCEMRNANRREAMAAERRTCRPNCNRSGRCTPAVWNAATEIESPLPVRLRCASLRARARGAQARPLGMTRSFGMR